MQYTKSLAAIITATLLAGCTGAIDPSNGSPSTSNDQDGLGHGHGPNGGGGGGGATGGGAGGSTAPSALDSDDPTGVLRTIDVNGPIDTSNAFFQSLGTNGRSCSTCHVATSAWTITPEHVQRRFAETDGRDPLFRTNDGSNSPKADVSTTCARREAYSMLLDKAVIRIGIAIPMGAEFELVGVDDPYHFASAAQLSLFRRPLPTTNLKFLSAVMWDGRETFTGQTMHFDLGHQANGATTGHAEAAQDLTDADREAIVGFETGLFTAQIFDRRAGDLRAFGGRGGPETLVTQDFFLGINDPFGLNPTHAPFDPDAFTLYQAWRAPAAGCDRDPDHDGDRDHDRGGDRCRGGDHGCDDRGRDGDHGGGAEARASVARGEDLFNRLPIAISGVKGLNDELNVPVFDGHCTTCHDTPNVGDHSIAAPLDIGIADASRRTPDLPLYTLRNKATHAVVQTTDPGRALISGKWKDIGRFKGPILRGLAARAPYFHNGSADSLEAVVRFYDDRFALHLAPDQIADLVAFLRTL